MKILDKNNKELKVGDRIKYQHPEAFDADGDKIFEIFLGIGSFYEGQFFGYSIRDINTGEEHDYGGDVLVNYQKYIEKI